MGDITAIGWTDKTHNEWIGCQKVTGEECRDCYALRWAKRRHMEIQEFPRIGSPQWVGQGRFLF
jgi:protein gp37